MRKPKPLDPQACSLCYRVTDETKAGKRCPYCSGEFVSIVRRAPGRDQKRGVVGNG